MVNKTKQLWKRNKKAVFILAVLIIIFIMISSNQSIRIIDLFKGIYVNLFGALVGGIISLMIAKMSIQSEKRKEREEELKILYDKITKAQSFYINNYDGRMSSDTLYYYAELKNYITIKRFSMDGEIYEKARECENLISNLYTDKYAARSYQNSDPNSNQTKNYCKRVEDIQERLNNSIQEIQTMINKKLVEYCIPIKPAVRKSKPLNAWNRASECGVENYFNKVPL